jgi:hypothetical protein
VIPGLLSRIKVEVDRLGQASRRDRHQSLSLVGVCNLIGVEFDTRGLCALTDEKIASTLEHQMAKRPERDYIIASEAILWLGIRAVARSCSRSIAIPPHLGELTLNLWTNNESPDGRQRWLDTLMIEWLQASEQASWRLARDEGPLPDLIDALSAQTTPRND